MKSCSRSSNQNALFRHELKLDFELGAPCVCVTCGVLDRLFPKWLRQQMNELKKASSLLTAAAVSFAAILLLCSASSPTANPQSAANSTIAVGPQYDSTHVYVASADLDALVRSFTVTFGGQASKPLIMNVLPVPSSTEFQAVSTPAGILSVFAFQTPIPFPFGQERTGYLVNDMDAAIKTAHAAGAEVIVEPFKDPIGRDAVIQFPGGLKTQLYWHTTPPNSLPLETIPDNRVYVSRDQADNCVNSFIAFSHGKVIEDNLHADAGEIGRPAEIFRRIRITSLFGNMQVNVTDGHLPYPFGHEITGYQVRDLNATLEKAKASGAKILSPPFQATDRVTAVVQFPGGYIAEIHSVSAR
jgi:predicted enzyme related to lactoylglutathione lyase